MHPRILAFKDPPTLQSILAECRLQGQPIDGNITFVTPSPALVSQAVLTGRISQVVCNVLPQAHPEQDHSTDPIATSSQRTQSTAPTQRKIKMSHIIDQMCDDEDPILGAAAINQACAMYHKRMG